MTVDGERETPASVWARRHHGAPRRPTLTRDAIVETALKVADSDGLAAVSMRRIASELGARVMSLYHHVARKEDLLVLMADTVTAEVLVPEPLPESWREAIALIARREREVAARHPWMGDIVAMPLEVGPNMLRHAEQTLAALSGLDLPPERLVEVSMAIDHYVLGHTMRERWDMFTRPEGGDLGERTVEALSASPVFREMSERGELPRLSPMLARGLPRAGVDSFEQGLTWLLDGIERDVVPRR